MPAPAAVADGKAIRRQGDGDFDEGAMGEGEEGEEEEEEPRLKYQRLGSDVADILARDEASCLCVSDKMLVLGTHNGTVHLLSCAGDEVKCFDYHKAAVTGLSFDSATEYIASCSDDGTVVIRSLCSEELYTFNYQRPLKSIALDPRFSSRKTQEFVTGGVAGKLLLNSRGWLGKRDTVLHAGEGPIHIVRWAGSFIAWANDVGVKVYDSSSHKHIGSVDRPRGTHPSTRMQCQLFWETDNVLLIGWAHTISVASIQSPEPTSTVQCGVAILAKFDIDGIVSGIAPFGNDLAVLAYMTTLVDKPGQVDPKNGAHLKPCRPELRIITRENDEKSSDALSIGGFEHYVANDYSLTTWGSGQGGTNGRQMAGASPSGRSTQFVDWWTEGDEPLFYVVSSKEVVVAKPRDGSDRVNWLLTHRRYEKALKVAESLRKRDPDTYDQVVDRYMDHLFTKQRFEEAGKMCPKLLHHDYNRWERYIFHFAQRSQLHTLAKHIPTSNPTLKPAAYNMVLRTCVPFPAQHRRLLELVTVWPSTVYSVTALTKEVQQKVEALRGDKSVLMEVLAQLYQLQNMHANAVDIYIKLRWPSVFEYIVKHRLLPALNGKLTALISLNEDKALELLVENSEDMEPGRVVTELQAAMEVCKDDKDKRLHQKWEKWLFRYMDRLVKANPLAAPEFHQLLVELYADYDVASLMGFLRSSHQYPLDVAYEVCKKRGLVKEQVYVLGRMGNSNEALQLIIKELADMDQAIEFAKSQNDDELWDSLIDWAVGTAATTGDLLDHVGGMVDPLRVITQIPRGMEIANLRNRLVRIISDFRTQTSLQEGCSHLLRSDCVRLATRMYGEIRRALKVVHVCSHDAASPEEGAWYEYATTTGGLSPSVEPQLENVTVLDYAKPRQVAPGASSSGLLSRMTSGGPSRGGWIRMGFVEEKPGDLDDVTRFRYMKRAASLRKSHGSHKRLDLPSLV
ncbi:unnamed protein product [Ostreobium quekettii]|uniref:Vacuolar protein sorting-associated protein 41 homolog n=1 Tax=Ostreobium quekettii TaxID=121088 RepID=A0A8S1IXT7_9CHLO|nr:unnamed protein product [Ostreobium quekettii]|eukprot:evm.model.scf_1060.3 EVM.evm.TU.scf_1060.3   scf_1060:15733-31935(-)